MIWVCADNHDDVYMFPDPLVDADRDIIADGTVCFAGADIYLHYNPSNDVAGVERFSDAVDTYLIRKASARETDMIRALHALWMLGGDPQGFEIELEEPN